MKCIHIRMYYIQSHWDNISYFVHCLCVIDCCQPDFKKCILTMDGPHTKWEEVPKQMTYWQRSYHGEPYRARQKILMWLNSVRLNSQVLRLCTIRFLDPYLTCRAVFTSSSAATECNFLLHKSFHVSKHQNHAPKFHLVVQIVFLSSFTYTNSYFPLE